MKQKVLVIGGGAMGLLMVHDLLTAGIRVGLMTRSEQQRQEIEAQGICVTQGGQQIIIHPNETFSHEAYAETALLDYQAVLVAVKQYHLKELWSLVRSLSAHGIPVTFLVNGLAHFHYEQKHPLASLTCTAITHHGVTKLSHAAIAIKGRGATYIGPTQVGSKVIESRILQGTFLHNIFSKLNWQIVEDVFPYALKKGVVNACINPLTALFGVKNGALIDNKLLNQIMRLTYDEIKTIIHESSSHRHYNYLFEKDMLWQEIEGVCRNTSDNYSSMYQDIQMGRRTEIEAINGYFVRLIQETNLAEDLKQLYTKVNSVLMFSIKAKEV